MEEKKESPLARKRGNQPKDADEKKIPLRISVKKKNHDKIYEKVIDTVKRLDK